MFVKDVVSSLVLFGALSTGGSLPFWMTAGQYGIYPDSSGGLALVRVEKTDDHSRNFDFSAGASLALRADGFKGPGHFNTNPLVDELYGTVRWKKLNLELGMKHQSEDFFGSSRSLGSLSTTGGHLAWSNNSRQVPGVNLVLDPVAFPWTNGHLVLSGSFGDYATYGPRYIDKALFHRTKLFAEIFFTDRFSLKLGLDHYAIWGGSGPTGSVCDVNFGNYLRIITGSSGGGSSTAHDKRNVVGDQGGTELIRFKYAADDWDLVFQHEIPYNDKSGMKFQNFPDGVNTLAFSRKDKDRWVSDIVWEFYYTMYQSGPIHDSEFDSKGNPIPWRPGLVFIGLDNYFNNEIYCSGWTHFGRAIASPLFFPAGTKNGTWNRNAVTLGVENNRIIANHIGLSGKFFRKLPYRLMLTHSMNYGTYYVPYKGVSQMGKPWGTVKETPLHQFSAGLSGEVPGLFGSRGLNLTYGLYFDAGEVLEKNFGALVGLRYNIF